MVLAKSLGYYCTIVSKNSYASNTELKTVREYKRIIIYINQINDPIPVLLDRKKINENKTSFCNPIILINGEKPKERMKWTDNLDKLLLECIKQYQSNKGKKFIPWAKIVDEIEEFENVSPNALRTRYRVLK